MLSAHRLGSARGERVLFHDLDLALEPGRWLHVSGDNGAGKTTLLRTLTGLAAPDHGEVRWRGVCIRERAREFRAELIYLGHPAALKDELTPLENLTLCAALDGAATQPPAAAAALQRMGLAASGRLPTRHLSAGQKRRVLLARLLLRPAALWVLDEPFAALDTAALQLGGEMIQAHLASGGMAVVTSHQPLPLPPGACSVVAL